MCYHSKGFDKARDPPHDPRNPFADVAELVDALVSGSSVSTFHQ